tara:strand:+ start:3342 stop:3563 length:222 start_codon:yes stop_codon:yes gene_type:complete
VTPEELSPEHLNIFSVLVIYICNQGNPMQDKLLEIFSQEQWDLIYDALSEYQDHDETYDLTRDTLNQLSSHFQ